MVVGFLFVRLEVLHHVVLPDEPLTAIITGVRLFASVQAHVPSEVSFVVELLRAYLALVRLVAGVLLQVLGVQVLEGEPLAALIAFERLVAGVEALVVLRQVAGLVEDLVALDALVKAVLRYIMRAGVRAGHLMLLRDHGAPLQLRLLFELTSDVRVQLLLRLYHLRQIVVRLEIVPDLLQRMRHVMRLDLVLLQDHSVRVRLHPVHVHARQRLVPRRRASVRIIIRSGRFERSVLRRCVLLRT